jgi:hypothetical protein
MSGPRQYKVERWDWHVEETVASAGLILIDHAAFHAASSNTLAHG